MSWILFNEGRKRPFKSQLARLIWALLIGLFSGALTVLMALGFAEAIGNGRMLADAIIFAIYAVGLGVATVACGVAAVRAVRELRATSR